MPGQFTQLLLQNYNNGILANPTMFVLMENMPTTISEQSGHGTAIVARKILAFGGPNRTLDPSLQELSAFNVPSQAALWKAAKLYSLIVITYQSSFQGFYGNPPTDFYYNVLNGWEHNLIYDISQEIVESRLYDQPNAQRPFYSWI
jgi:hypothetical protein